MGALLALLVLGAWPAIEPCPEPVPEGMACVVTGHPTEPRAIRACVDAGAARVGQPCQRADECSGGVCYGGVCSAVCDRPADCPDPFSCDELPLSVAPGVTVNVGLCRLEEIVCGRQRDCPEGLSCAYVEERQEVQSRCVPTNGGDAGAPCDNGADCQAAVCLDGACSAVCRNDGDCPRDMECNRIRFMGASVNACVRLNVPETDAATPPAGDAEPPPPAQDASQPSADPDTGAPPPPGRDMSTAASGDSSRTPSPGDAGGPVVVIADTEDDQDGASGCRAAPAVGTGWAWWLLIGAIRRRRRPA